MSDFHFVLQFLDDEEVLNELDLDHSQIAVKRGEGQFGHFWFISIGLSGDQHNEIKDMPILAERTIP